MAYIRSVLHGADTDLVWFMINDHIFDVANRGDEKDHTEMKEIGKENEEKKKKKEEEKA